MPSRVLNWDVHVTTWAIAQRGRPFIWGETDCGSLTREGHRVMYGRDLYEDIGSWLTAYSASRILVEHHGFGAILRSRGALAVPYHSLQTGDVVLGDAPGRAAALVVAGRLLIADEEGGVLLEEAPATVAGEAAVYRLPWTVSLDG